MHWGKALNSDLTRANNLTSPLVDEKSKEPDFKFTAVSVEKYVPIKQKMQFRIGINLGDVIEDRGDIYGDGVNLVV